MPLDLLVPTHCACGRELTFIERQYPIRVAWDDPALGERVVRTVWACSIRCTIRMVGCAS